MASFSLPKPGTEFGPCIPTCEHIDCAETIRQAAIICHYCGEEIGFDRQFFFIDKCTDRELVHSVCYIEANDQPARAERN